jgi:hypothetical protein
MNRKIYCPCDSDFSKHYQHQAGSGFSDLTVFKGQPYQRGYGLGSVFKRFGIPILKFLGKQLFKTGVNVGNDILSGSDVRASFKAHGRKGLRTAAKEGLGKLSELVDQTGAGIRKRKRKTKIKTKTKKSKRDIFS